MRMDKRERERECVCVCVCMRACIETEKSTHKERNKSEHHMKTQPKKQTKVKGK